MSVHDDLHSGLTDEWLRYEKNDLIVAKHSFGEFAPKANRDSKLSLPAMRRKSS